MSIYGLRTVHCGECGAERTVKVVDSANPQRHPAFLTELLERTFLRSTCPRCGTVATLESPLLWTDVPYGLAAWMLPAEARPGWSALELEVAAGLSVPVRGEGPGFVRRWGERCTLRLVFGLEELREKVVAARAGLDDRVVEALKLAHADMESLHAPLLERAGEDGVHFTAPDLVVGWDDYRTAEVRLDDEPAWRGLATGTWVHWLRAAFRPLSSV